MKTYAISDLHGHTPEPPADADCLVIAGDICPDFRNKGNFQDGYVKQAAWLDTTFRSWLGFHGLPTFVIWGNHDFIGEHPGLVPDLPWLLSTDEGFTLPDGRRCWGTPWVPNLPYWAFYGRPEVLKRRSDDIPDWTDVLVTHGPPFYFGDYIPPDSKYGNYGGEHVGDRTLNEAIRRAKPEVTICGHIHEARGSHKMDGQFRIENVAAVDAYYKLVEDPWVLI